MSLRDYLKIYYLNEFRYVGKTRHHYVVQKVGTGEIEMVEEKVEMIPEQEEKKEWLYLFWDDGKEKDEIIDWK